MAEKLGIDLTRDEQREGDEGRQARQSCKLLPIQSDMAGGSILMAFTFSIEVPFPSDCARFKVICRDTETGKGMIVAAAQTLEDAQAKLVRCAAEHAQQVFAAARLQRRIEAEFRAKGFSEDDIKGE